MVILVCSTNSILPLLKKVARTGHVLQPVPDCTKINMEAWYLQSFKKDCNILVLYLVGEILIFFLLKRAVVLIQVRSWCDHSLVWMMPMHLHINKRPDMI